MPNLVTRVLAAAPRNQKKKKKKCIMVKLALLLSVGVVLSDSIQWRSHLINCGSP